MAHTPLQKIGAFFYPNNEHITFFSHLVYFTQYQLLGEIRFYPLILIGHLIIVATACLMGTAIDNSRRPFYFATITIGYINLYCWDSSFKAMTAISNQAVLLFAVATFFALLRWHKLDRIGVCLARNIFARQRHIGLAIGFAGAASGCALATNKKALHFHLDNYGSGCCRYLRLGTPCLWHAIARQSHYNFFIAGYRFHPADTVCICISGQHRIFGGACHAGYRSRRWYSSDMFLLCVAQP
ncbi:MAG: hypothetical protein IPK95_06895 [Cellvibrionales bacterium]|nr:hypothetical protein [Cellvibrionales bacterium]